MASVFGKFPWQRKDSNPAVRKFSSLLYLDGDVFNIRITSRLTKAWCNRYTRTSFSGSWHITKGRKYNLALRRLHAFRKEKFPLNETAREGCSSINGSQSILSSQHKDYNHFHTAEKDQSCIDTNVVRASSSRSGADCMRFEDD